MINFSEEEIRIFGKNFAVNNKDKFIILYENKIFFQYKEYFPKKYMNIDNIERLEIYLIAFDKISNVSYMFDKCSALEELIFNKNEKYNSFLDINNSNHILPTNKIIKKEIYINNLENSEENNEFAKYLDILDNLKEKSISPTIMKNINDPEINYDIFETIINTISTYFNNRKLSKIYKKNIFKKSSTFEDISLYIHLSDITQ